MLSAEIITAAGLPARTWYHLAWPSLTRHLAAGLGFSPEKHVANTVKVGGASSAFCVLWNSECGGGRGLLNDWARAGGITF